MAKIVDWDARIGGRVRLRDLHILLAVVQCGSMAKAARQLGVSQPAVTEAVAVLREDRFDILFVIDFCSSSGGHRAALLCS